MTAAPNWIVAIGASAGGVEALKGLLGALPASVDAAFLVVLHIPPHSPSQLDRVLAGATKMPVHAPQDGDRLLRGHVYVACADQHLIVEHGMVRHSRGPKECRSRPAIDVLFRSAAVAYGPRVIGVVLSGMLDDGTAGLWAIKEQRGIALVQEPGEAMHADMPNSALRHVQADLVAPTAQLARKIAEVTALPPQAHPGSEPARLVAEAKIANEGNGLQLGVMEMGQVSQYTCPDCHGVLVKIEEGSIVRFRCHTGHAFSLQTLLAEISESIDKGLWDAIRAIEERALLLRELSRLLEEGDASGRKDLDRLAEDAETSTQSLKKLVMDVRLFGRLG